MGEMYEKTFRSGFDRYPSSCFEVEAIRVGEVDRCPILMWLDASWSALWTLHSGWLDSERASQWRRLLQEQVDWQQPTVQVYGRRHRVPRFTTFFAEEGLRYRYSGTVHKGAGWPSWFRPLLDRVNQACDSRFNGCLLNLYRNGDDRMGWHADDEPEINQQRPIASLSLGASRDFVLRERTDQRRMVSLPLSNGDLLVMHPGCQQRWMHSLPTRRRVLNTRINLTFRCFQTP